jgi:uncharacterized membrane protein
VISWPIFTLVFIAFFATHTIPVRPKVKARLQNFLGPTGFTLTYSALSLVMLGLVIMATGRAPYVQLWSQAVWQYYVVDIGMFIVCVIIAMTIGCPNPFSFGGAHSDQFNPEHPGITRFTRHPLLTALALWAGLHLLPNGDLAHIIMFGIFFGFAILGRKIIDRRNQRLMGVLEWRALVQKSKSGSIVFPPQNWLIFLVRLSIAVVSFVVLILLHQPILGVDPLPL